MNKKVLVVVDYQRDFASSIGALSVPNGEQISEIIQREINNPIYEDVIYTLDAHIQKDYKSSTEAEIFPMHCEFNTPGWELFNIKARNIAINRVLSEKIFEKPTDFSIGNEFVFVKDKFSIWDGNKNYLKFISERYGRDNTEFVIVGLATNYCVFDNVMGYHKIGFRNVSVIEDGVKAILDDSYENAIQEMKNIDINFIGGA